MKRNVIKRKKELDKISENYNSFVQIPEDLKIEFVEKPKEELDKDFVESINVLPKIKE
ncbi:hypothetical protein [Spiroplasma endosymbiont of Labia minor]|uniref:hypothetical protein n=1 Tax=Spiroplasma endosymbiont of Labia minor TaxID=3066305 RepID=UPI0030D10B89